MIDSHVHLNHGDFAEDRDAVIARARDVGVTHVVNIGFDLPSSRETAALVEANDFMYGAVGIHPHDAKTYSDDVDKELEALLGRPRVIAVGEIGLDYYRDLTPRTAQRDVFIRQLEMAARLGKPVIIHCRDAFDDTIAVLRESATPWRGIFHAFTGNGAAAETILDMGFHVGIGGVITFRNSTLAEVVAGLPPDSFVLETDCPYLTPAPFRGKRNEPAYLGYVVEKIALVTGRPPGEIRSRTTENFRTAMGLAGLGEALGG